VTRGRPAIAVPGLPVPARAIPRLTAIADRAAKENGDAAPSWISAVVTTQEQALAFVDGGSGPGGNTVVYLLRMEGHFLWPRAGPGPLSGQRPGRGQATTYASWSAQRPLSRSPGVFGPVRLRWPPRAWGR
jgi:hypothetical protein